MGIVNEGLFEKALSPRVPLDEADQHQRGSHRMKEDRSARNHCSNLEVAYREALRVGLDRLMVWGHFLLLSKRRFAPARRQH